MKQLAVATALFVMSLSLSLSSPARAEDGDQRLLQMEEMIQVQQAQIAAQQAQIMMLSQQVQKLIVGARTQVQTAGAVTVTPTRSGEIVPPPANPVAKTVRKAPAPVKSGGKKASLSLSGHVNRAGLFYNDGATSDIRSVDNDNSSTRIRLKGKVSPSDDVTVGSIIEIEIESNSSRSITQNDNESAEDTSNDGSRDPSDVTFAERIIDIYVDSKTFGKLTIGQGSTASDKTTESDLSGTKVVTSSDIKDVGGDLLFARRDGTFSTIAVDMVFANMDGLSRADRIRYDTPIYQGLRASVSLLDGGAWDAALHYGQKLFTFKVKAAAGYANASSTSSSMERQFSGSLSVLHNSGLNLTVAGALRDMSGGANMRKPRFIYSKLGYKAKLVKFGYTALSVDYGASWDQPADRAKGHSVSFAVVQNITNWGTELYTSFRRLKLNVPGLSVDNMDTVLAGARITF